MNYVEEQKNELEALSEIYYNEIEVKSNEPPISFSIAIRPQASYYEQPEMTGDDDGGADSDESDVEEGTDSLQCPTVKMMFELPSNYPELKPSMQVLDSQNLENHEIEELLGNLSEKCDQSLGNVMIFELVSDVVEWLSSKAEREANEVAREQAKKIEALEAEERKKCDGIMVTADTFLAWKAKFDAELLKQKLQQQMSQADATTGQRRLTGREMFETDGALAESDLNFVDELEQGQLEALMQSINEAELNDDDDNDDDDDLDEEDLSDDDLSEEDLSEEEDDSDND